MANIYFEIADCLLERNLYKSKYLVAHDVSTRMSIQQDSMRIWCEQEGIVWYLKNKHWSPSEVEVDMKEFIWIKLSAKVVE